MLGHPLAHFERQVQSWKSRVRIFEPLHNAKSVQVVIESLAVTPHKAIELGFTRMPERRMADVMRQSQRFSQILIQAEHIRCRCARSAVSSIASNQPVAEQSRTKPGVKTAVLFSSFQERAAE